MQFISPNKTKKHSKTLHIVFSYAIRVSLQLLLCFFFFWKKLWILQNGRKL